MAADTAVAAVGTSSSAAAASTAVVAGGAAAVVHTHTHTQQPGLPEAVGIPAAGGVVNDVVVATTPSSLLEPPALPSSPPWVWAPDPVPSPAILRCGINAFSERGEEVSIPRDLGAWPCPACTFHNPPLHRRCEMCDTWRPSPPPNAKKRPGSTFAPTAEWGRATCGSPQSQSQPTSSGSKRGKRAQPPPTSTTTAPVNGIERYLQRGPCTAEGGLDHGSRRSNFNFDRQ